MGQWAGHGVSRRFCSHPRTAHATPIQRPDEAKLIVLGIRAENMETLSHPADDALPVEVLVVEPLGAQNLLTVKIERDMKKVSTYPTFAVSPG